METASKYLEFNEVLEQTFIFPSFTRMEAKVILCQPHLKEVTRGFGYISYGSKSILHGAVYDDARVLSGPYYFCTLTHNVATKA
mmetsp:Transcript_12716/g.14832  ORF Transcript_12716/g.14832 Transcript_12716/m.14832 type:complete len:84 (-) Transcript_12716:19-270(-)